MYWLIGLIQGDGYIDDRHVEIYSSSETISRHTVKVLQKLGISKKRIKVDIYSHSQRTKMISKWSHILKLPKDSFKLRENTSPWKSNREKLRIRVASKELVIMLKKAFKNIKNKKAYVKGLFDAEASVDIKGYIEFKQLASSDGMKIVLKTHAIIKKLGISTTKPKTKKDRNIKTDIYFYVKALRKYQKEIGFVDTDKKTKLQKLIKIRKANQDPSAEQVIRLVKQGKSIWEIMNKLESPYHKVRREKNRLTARQTR
ncbi:MAG: hypothetical protein JRI41_09825 [Deltaproteobacteria bacterium]|nr:hypothetical protein [Deltaproteobacteria bacterium]